MKGKSKGKDSKGKNFGSSSGASASSSTLCWTCGKTGHFSSKCPLNRVNAVEEELYEEVVDETGADFEAPWDDWSEWTVGALFDESWDSWDESLWDSSWDESWDWSGYQDFDSWSWYGWWPEATPQKTLQKPQKTKEEQTLQQPQASQATVSAVTLESPPGLSKAKPKPKAKSAISPSTLLMSALVLGNFWCWTVVEL